MRALLSAAVVAALCGGLAIAGGPHYDETETGLPLSGGTMVGDISMGDNDITDVNAMSFTLSPTHVHSEGSVHWDDDDKTLHIDSEVTGVALQTGQENWVRATNKTGVQIDNGTVVYVNGAQGSRPTITKVDADVPEEASHTIGVATQDIADNATGYVTTFGLVRSLDTSGFTAGDALYAGQTAGAIVNVAPAPPAMAVRVGYCLSSNASDGVVFVSVSSITSQLVGDATPGLIIADTTTTGDANGRGDVYFIANDDGGNVTTMAHVGMDVTDAGAAQEDADLVFSAVTNASLDEYLRLDASEGWIATSKPLRGGAYLYTSGALYSETATGGALYLDDSTKPGDVSGAGNMYFRAYNLASTAETYARLEMDVTDVSAGAEYADLVAYGFVNGTSTEMLRLDGSAGGVVIPATNKLYFDGGGDLDTYISETSEDDVIWVTAGNRKFETTGADVTLYTNAGALYVQPNTVTLETIPAVYLFRKDTTTTDADVIANLYFRAYDDAGTPAVEDYAAIQATVIDNAAAGPDGKLCMQADHNGTLTDELCVQGGTNEGTYIPATKKLFFDGGGDYDTYLVEGSEDQIDLYVGNLIKTRQTTTDRTVYNAGFVLRNTTDPINGGTVANLTWTAEDDASNADNFARIAVVGEEDASGDEDGSWDLQVMNDGTAATSVLKCDMTDGSEACVFGRQVVPPNVATMTPTGTTQTVDWQDGNNQIIDLGSATGDVTLTFSNPAAKADYSLTVIQGAVARNIVWPGTVKWPGGVVPTISTGNDDIDLISCPYRNSVYLCNAGQDYQ